MSAAVLDAIDGHCRRSQSLFAELGAAPLLPSAFGGEFTCDGQGAQTAPFLATATIHSLASTVAALVRRVGRLEATCVVLEGRTIGATTAFGGSGGTDPAVIGDAIAASLRPVQEVLVRHDRAIQQIAAFISEAQHQTRLEAEQASHNAVSSAGVHKSPQTAGDDALRTGPSTNAAWAAKLTRNAAEPVTSSAASADRIAQAAKDHADANSRLRGVLDELNSPLQQRGDDNPRPDTAAQRPATAPAPVDRPQRTTAPHQSHGGPASRNRHHQPAASSSSPTSTDVDLTGGGLAAARRNFGAAGHQQPPSSDGRTFTGTTGTLGSSIDPPPRSFTTEDAIRVLWNAGHLRNGPAGSPQHLVGTHDESAGTRAGDTTAIGTSFAPEGTSFELSAWAGDIVRSLTVAGIGSDTDASALAAGGGADASSSSPYDRCYGQRHRQGTGDGDHPLAAPSRQQSFGLTVTDTSSAAPMPRWGDAQGDVDRAARRGPGPTRAGGGAILHSVRDILAGNQDVSSSS